MNKTSSTNQTLAWNARCHNTAGVTYSRPSGPKSDTPQEQAASIEQEGR